MQKAIKRYFPVFVLPTLIAFTIGFLAPFVLGVYLSFCKFTTVTDARFIGLGNYAKIPGDAYCVRIKITHDEEGNDWNYLKIYILLKPES